MDTTVKNAMTEDAYTTNLKILRKCELIIRKSFRIMWRLLDDVYAEKIQSNDTNMTLYLSLTLASDYYTGAKHTLNHRCIIASRALTRCLLEALINLENIFEKTEDAELKKKLLRSFAKNVEVHPEKMRAFGTKIDTKNEDLNFHTINPWTNEPINSRVKKSEWSKRFLYNQASGAVHANPAEAISHRTFYRYDNLISVRIDNIQHMLEIIEIVCEQMTFEVLEYSELKSLSNIRVYLLKVMQTHMQSLDQPNSP